MNKEILSQHTSQALRLELWKSGRRRRHHKTPGLTGRAKNLSPLLRPAIGTSRPTKESYTEVLSQSCGQVRPLLQTRWGPCRLLAHCEETLESPPSGARQNASVKRQRNLVAWFSPRCTMGIFGPRGADCVQWRLSELKPLHPL